LPAGSRVPSAHDDPSIDRQIRLNDGVDGEVQLVHAFSDGNPVVTWDFGPAPAFAAPLFRLVDADGERLAHPHIVEAIPGGDGYSPFWAVLEVKVTDQYDGELLTSFAALQEAQRIGLVEAPVQLDEAVNSPIVARGVALDVGGAAPQAPTAQLFWEGMTVDSYDFGRMALESQAIVQEVPRYLLHRVGGEPINEVERRIDLTGDGDQDDTNDILVSRPGDPTYSPLCRTVETAIAAGTAAIDTTGSQAMTAVDSAADLFDPPSEEENILLGTHPTDDVRNCPQQPEPDR
jgi:hypothetical protein